MGLGKYIYFSIMIYEYLLQYYDIKFIRLPIPVYFSFFYY